MGTVKPADLLREGAASNDGSASAYLSGDYNGDTNPDTAVAYKYDNDRMAFFMFLGNGVGPNSPVKWWESPVGGWSWDRSKFVASDFNKDGKTDIGVLYDYGNAETKLWIFFSNGAGFGGGPVLGWASGPGNWEWSRTTLIPGDFNGDTNPDVMAVYRYDNARMMYYAFLGNGSGPNNPIPWWDSGPGVWEASRSKFTAGDYNLDGKTDISVLYDYDNAESKLWVFFSNGAGFGSGPTLGWASGVGNWDWKRSRLIQGDFNGDGKADTAVAYKYDGEQMAFIMFLGNGSGPNNPSAFWFSGVGDWDWERSKFTASDFNKDGKTDIGVLYDYGNANTRYWIFFSNGAGFGAGPALGWDSLVNNWEWSRTAVV